MSIPLIKKQQLDRQSIVEFLKPTKTYGGHLGVTLQFDSILVAERIINYYDPVRYRLGELVSLVAFKKAVLCLCN